MDGGMLHCALAGWDGRDHEGECRLSSSAVFRYMQKWCKAWEVDLENRPPAVKSSGPGEAQPSLREARLWCKHH